MAHGSSPRYLGPAPASSCASATAERPGRSRLNLVCELSRRVALHCAAPTIVLSSPTGSCQLHTAHCTLHTAQQSDYLHSTIR